MTVSAKVRNSGAVPGREVVQLYVTVPFGSGAEYQRLVAFAKTKELAPGQEETISMTVPVKLLACFDEAAASWVLRNEWGFAGLVMSDWDSMKASREDPAVPATGDVQKAHSAQCDLVMPGRPDQIEAVLKGIESGAVSEDDLRRSAARLLKLVRSNTIVESH